MSRRKYTSGEFAELIGNSLPFSPNEDQKDALRKISEFLFFGKENPVFVLKGYAGTGKTNLISAITKNLMHLNMQSILLAPTGRAAKVITNYSKKEAFTIHKKIYSKSESEGGAMNFYLAENHSKNTLFIVDEASMIGGGGDNRGFTSNSLLHDLFSYVFSGENCRLMISGDTAQLPPVGSDLSPALNLNYLKTNFHLDLFSTELKQVARQEQESGILYNATLLRIQLFAEQFSLPKLSPKKDFIRVNGEELEDTLQQVFSEFGEENVMIITRSNKRAGLFNQSFRNRIRYYEEDLCSGDKIMIVKNNYFWPEGNKGNEGFIANGDMAEITKIIRREDMYGFHFADCMIRFSDNDKLPDMEVKLITDCLYTDAPALTNEQQLLLYEKVKEDIDEESSDSVKKAYVRKSKYYNALQVKFSYAVTCHKSQGGQWSVIFIDQGYLNMDEIDTNYLRWLYTAVTRATEKVYLINFNDLFFN